MKQNLTNIFLIIMAAIAPVHHAYGEINSKWEASFLGPETFWGVETNGVKSALYIVPISGTNGTPIVCTPILKSSRTNVLWLYFPPTESRFQMELLDGTGHLVPRTVKGEALGKPLTRPFRLTTGINYRAGYTGIPPLHKQTELLGGSEFKLQDYFLVTNAGTYHLKFQMNVIWFPPNWKGHDKTTNVPITTLPAVNAQIEIKKP